LTRFHEFNQGLLQLIMWYLVVVES